MSEFEDVLEIEDSSIYDENMQLDESLQSSGSFRLKLRFNEMIKEGLVKQVIRDVHRTYLEGRTWDDLDPKIVSNTISSEIKEGVKNICRSIRQGYKYKYIIQTFIGKLQSQSVTIHTRCLWDDNTDRIVYENFKKGNIICVSEVVFIYFY